MNNDTQFLNTLKSGSSGTPTAPATGGSDWYSQVKNNAYTPEALSGPKPAPSFGERVQTDFSSRMDEAGNNLNNPKLNDFTKGFSGGASILSMIPDVAGEAVKSIPGASGAMDAFSKYTPAGGIIKGISDGIGKIVNSPEYQSLKDTHPNTYAILNALGQAVNTAGVIEGGKSLVENAPAIAEVTGNVVSKGANALESGISKVKGLAADKETQALVDATSGVADKNARISSLEQTGALDKNGNPIGGTKQTLTGGIKTEPTAFDLARAEDTKGIVKPGASPVDNLTNLNKEISRISEQEVTPALEKAGATTPISDKAPGWNTTVQRLSDIPKPDIITADPVLDKTYDLVRNRMIEQIQKQPPTVKGLWEARKGFDTVVKDQFGDAAFNSEKNTAIKRAISDMRRTVNDIIGERVPEYKPQMSKLSNLYDARYNIAEQYQSLVNKGGIKAFVALNPKTAAALKWGVGALGYETAKHTVAPFLPGI